MRRHLTYANVTATLALVLAMSGGAVAAKHYLLSSTKQIDPKVLSALAAQDAAVFKRLAKTTTVARAQTAVSATTAATATSATSAQTAQTATSAQSAVIADTARNALAFGGLPASSFTHNDCASITGQIKGFVLVPASSSTPNRFEPVGGYNCSGQPVEVKRTSPGLYIVRFDESPATIAVATVNAAGPGGATDPQVAFASVNLLAPGEFAVHVFEPDPGIQVDVPFNMVLP